MNDYKELIEVLKSINETLKKNNEILVDIKSRIAGISHTIACLDNYVDSY